jgi:hypothetical protein
LYGNLHHLLSQVPPPTTQIKAAAGGMELRPNEVGHGLRMLPTIPTTGTRMRSSSKKVLLNEKDFLNRMISFKKITLKT